MKDNDIPIFGSWAKGQWGHFVHKLVGDLVFSVEIHSSFDVTTFVLVGVATVNYLKAIYTCVKVAIEKSHQRLPRDFFQVTVFPLLKKW